MWIEQAAEGGGGGGGGGGVELIRQSSEEQRGHTRSSRAEAAAAGQELCGMQAELQEVQVEVLHRQQAAAAAAAAAASPVEAVSGRFHILCGRFDWDLPICCVFWP
jgi:hypothetical protein